MTDPGALVLPQSSRTARPADGLATRDPRRCPACGRGALDVFFQQHQVPVTSNVSFRSREEALAVPRGDIRLAFCHACGMITNVAFEDQPVGDEVETSQAGSPRFQEYATHLARTWIDRYALRGETVLEIGCGRGEFLDTMVQQGAGHGVGVDPVLAGADAPSSTERLTYVGEFFRATHLDASVRAVICRHTLEHIYDTAEFLDALREAIGDRDMVVLFEVPDVERILAEAAFHDIYYEHCTYFSAGSLGRLFRHSGFEVLRLDRTYADQYLVIEARPARGVPAAPATDGDDRSRLWRGTQDLRAGYVRGVAHMDQLLRTAAEEGERVAFWGAGSKATAFLTALSEDAPVDCVVDINPRKWGTYIAGTGHAVVSPEHLREVRPGLVVLMNPAYRAEVARMLSDLEVDARLIGPDGDE